MHFTFVAERFEEDEVRNSADARRQLNLAQALYVSTPVKTGRIMVKDEDVCLHCGLCAERCPTGAWDMQKFLLEVAHADDRCRRPAAAAGGAGAPVNRLAAD